MGINHRVHWQEVYYQWQYNVSHAPHTVCANMTRNDHVTEKLSLISLHVFFKQFFLQLIHPFIGNVRKIIYVQLTW